MTKQLFFSCCLLLLNSTLLAQLNLHAGYNGAYFNSGIVNQILTDFDNSQPDFDNKLGTVNYMYGVVAGIHYRIDDFGIGATWYNQSKSPKASGIINDEEVFRDLFFRNNSYSLSLQGYLDFFSIGVAGEYQNIVIKSESTERTERNKIYSEGNWAGRVFLDFALARGTYSAIHLRPYVQLPFEELNVFGLQEELNPEAASGNDPADFNEKLWSVGISLYFSNGEQQ